MSLFAFNLAGCRDTRTGGPDVIREEAWSFYRTLPGARLCWELEEPQGPKESEGPGQLPSLPRLPGAFEDQKERGERQQVTSPWSERERGTGEPRS
jgi:hypothetical protein